MMCGGIISNEFSSRQLTAIHLVARRRSFARAAEALLITPSGVSAKPRVVAPSRFPAVRQNNAARQLDNVWERTACRNGT